MPIIVAVLALCCCAQVFGTLAIVGYVIGNPAPPDFVAIIPTETATAISTRPRIIPTAAPNLFPTNTRVIAPPTAIPRGETPTQRATNPASTAGGLYDIFIPTPTAPAMAYPVDFKSATTLATYTVTGNTLTAISDSLEKNAMPDPHEPGSRYYARTNWFIQGEWFWKPTARGCEMDRGTVSIAITITLPALKTTAGLAPDLLKRWNSFVSNTSVHEQGHARLALQGARDYQRNLGNFPPAANCDLLQNQLRDLYNRDFDAIDRVNVEYDKDTQHGLTQGAVFP